jgi:preprotein translocase subunit SecA
MFEVIADLPPQAASRRLEGFSGREGEDGGIDGFMPRLAAVSSLVGLPWRNFRTRQIGQQALRYSAEFATLSEAALDARRRELAGRLRAPRRQAAVTAQVLALIRETCRRRLGIEPYLEQVTAGAALVRGTALEMATGEGKTITAAFPAAYHALAGRAVHVVTTNDYLAERDCEVLRPVFAGLGLSTALITHAMKPAERRVAYLADIVYVSNKEVAFDYLRDRLITEDVVGDPDLFRKTRRVLRGANQREAPVQRGLDVAIVDEADSVLIDEAGTPLLISAERPADLDDETVARIFTLALKLEQPRDFVCSRHGISVELGPKGRDRIAAEAAGLDGVWRQRIRREALISAALIAIHVLIRDKHYIVREGKVVIVDENSGRTMEDRFWEQDLHAMVEHKEGCRLSNGKRSMASISFQRFFRRYRTLCGMSGTLREVAAELARVYGLRFARVKRRRPLRLRAYGLRVFATRDALWRAAADEAIVHRDAGRAVLIGVASVAEAAKASEALSLMGVSHRVLSAAQDLDEAEAVAKAGQAGAVTVATSMAGRGTDIKLGPGVAEAGGLVVMLCERHESARVDRQLIGRCARQGDPGGYVELLSLEDTILALAGRLEHWSLKLGLNSRSVFRAAQARLERAHATNRLDLVRRDQALKKVLAFAGGLD